MSRINSDFGIQVGGNAKNTESFAVTFTAGTAAVTTKLTRVDYSIATADGSAGQAVSVNETRGTVSGALTLTNGIVNLKASATTVATGTLILFGV